MTEGDTLGRPPLEPEERLAYGSLPEQFGEIRLPDGPGPHPVVVVVHGGCWRDAVDLHYMDRVAAALTGAGWATWSVELRGLGHPGGGWPGTFRDAGRAVDHLRVLADPYALDVGTVVTLGHSSGGHLALWLAARMRIAAGAELDDPAPLPVQGVVSLAGIADLEAFHLLEERACAGAVVELLGGAPRDVPERLALASPAAFLPLGVPQLLVTGEDDPDVPAAYVDAYAERAAAAGDDVRHVRLEGAGHFELVAPWWGGWERVLEPITGFLAEVAEG